MSIRTCIPRGLCQLIHVLRLDTSLQSPARYLFFVLFPLLPLEETGLKACNFSSLLVQEQRGPHSESRCRTDYVVLRRLLGAQWTSKISVFLHDHLIDRSQPDCPPRERIRQCSNMAHRGLTSGCFGNDCFRLCLSFDDLSSCALRLKLYKEASSYILSVLSTGGNACTCYISEKIERLPAVSHKPRGMQTMQTQ